MWFSTKTCLLIILSLAVLTLPSFSLNTPKDYLAAHNAVRGEVGVGPMRWDAKLASYAQDYALSTHGECENLVHSTGPYGENLAAGPGDGGFSGADAVELWAGEKKYYDHVSNTCVGGQVCGHYTQVVWRNSSDLGCARTPCSGGGWYVICSYNPPGNVIGESPY